MEWGRFITFEGGEGSGKSTHAHLLQTRLEQAGMSAVLTREPGGSPGAEEIRHLLVRGASERWSPMSETLLLYAARHDHLQRTIRPALRRGYWVICDRFLDSSHAYQGAAGGIPDDLLTTLDRHVVEDTRPDLTIILDLPPKTGLERALNRENEPGHEDRFERKKLEFHEKLRAGFNQVADKEPDRCAVIDTMRSQDEVEADVWRIVSERLLG